MVAQTVPADHVGADQALTVWVGVSGTRGDDLAQLGTFQTPGSLPTAWWETLPSNAQPIQISLTPGDLVCAEAYLAGHDSNGHQEWYFSMTDRTDGQEWDNALSMDVCGGSILWPSCNTVDLSSSEWIVETPQVAGRLSSLPAFSEVLFSNMDVYVNGIWSPLSTIQSGSNTEVLNLESSVEPTTPAYMTWVSSLMSGASNPTVGVEYLAYLSGVTTLNETSGVWLSATLNSADVITTQASPSPFNLAWTENFSHPNCQGVCRNAWRAYEVGFNISSGNYLLGPLPQATTGNASEAQACLWWAAPGSLTGYLAQGSLRLECEGSSPNLSPRPSASPNTPPPSNDSLAVLGIAIGIPGVLLAIDRKIKSRRSREGSWQKSHPRGASIPRPSDSPGITKRGSHDSK